MKVNNKVVPKTQVEVAVIPRGDEELVFKCQLVRDYSEFDALCPRPEVPNKSFPPCETYPQGRSVPDFDNASYKTKVATYAERKNAWTIIKSLEATDGIEWETVKMDDCTTWAGYMDELEGNNFSDTEIAFLMQKIIDANGMNERRIKVATESFLAKKRLEALDASSLLVEQSATLVGESAKG